MQNLHFDPGSVALGVIMHEISRGNAFFRISPFFIGFIFFFPAFSSLRPTMSNAASYRPGSPGGRPHSSSSHTKVEEELHEMAGIDYDKVRGKKGHHRLINDRTLTLMGTKGYHQAQSFCTCAL